MKIHSVAALLGGASVQAILLVTRSRTHLRNFLPGVPRQSVWRYAQTGWRPGVVERQLRETRPCQFCRDFTGTSKELLSVIIKRLDIHTILSGTGLGRTNNGAEAYMAIGKLSQYDCTLLAKHRQLSYLQSNESATRSVWLSCPDFFSFHHVPSTLIVTVSRVTGDGEQQFVICGTLDAQGVDGEPAIFLNSCLVATRTNSFLVGRSALSRSFDLCEVLKNNVKGIVCAGLRVGGLRAVQSSEVNAAQSIFWTNISRNLTIKHERPT